MGFRRSARPFSFVQRELGDARGPCDRLVDRVIIGAGRGVRRHRRKQGRRYLPLGHLVHGFKRAMSTSVGSRHQVPVPRQPTTVRASPVMAPPALLRRCVARAAMANFLPTPDIESEHSLDPPLGNCRGGAKLSELLQRQQTYAVREAS